jgi:hypothetical protein
MKKHLWSTVLLLALISCNNPLTTNLEKTGEPIPLVKYISTSAYPTAKMTENKKGYVLGEKMPDGMGKYTFIFYIDHIILQTNKIVNFKIDKVDKRFAPNEYTFYVNDPKGARTLITVSNIKDRNHTDIDFYEDFRNDIYNGFTKIICKKAD